MVRSKRMEGIIVSCGGLSTGFHATRLIAVVTVSIYVAITSNLDAVFVMPHSMSSSLLWSTLA